MDRRGFFSRAAGAVAAGLFGSQFLVPKNKEEAVMFEPDTQFRALRHIGTSFILVPEHEFWFGDESRLYGAGVVFVPTIKGCWHVYCEDPRYKGGTVVYVATRNIRDVFARNGHIYFGSIEA